MQFIQEYPEATKLNTITLVLVLIWFEITFISNSRFTWRYFCKKLVLVKYMKMTTTTPPFQLRQRLTICRFPNSLPTQNWLHWKNALTSLVTLAPNSQPAPLGLIAQVSTSSGSDQTRSQNAPLWGISWLRSMVRIWSRVLMSGERPPCTQRICSSINYMRNQNITIRKKRP